MTSEIEAVDIASLLCSRLCHDLMSPVGALNNGIELLADEQDPAMREKCLELLAESARASANKLKFFRLAFGAAGGFGEALDTGEARQVIEGLFGSDGRTTVGWVVESGKLQKSTIKLLLNLALIGGDALVRGGRLDIGTERTADGIEIAIRAEGPRIVLDQGIRSMLLSGSAELEPRTAGAWLANALASEIGGTIQLSQTDTVLVIGAQLPAQS